MKTLADLLSPDVLDSLKGLTHDEATKVIIDTVGEKAYADFLSGLNDDEVDKIMSLATEGAVIDGDDTLNSEKNDDIVADEQKEGEPADTTVTEDVSEPTEDGASATDDTTADNSANEDVVDAVPADDVGTDTDEGASDSTIDAAYVEGLEARVKELEDLLHTTIVDNAIELEASRQGCIDVSDIKKFIDTSTVEVIDNKANVADLVAELKKTKKYLFNSNVSGGTQGFNPAKPTEALDGVSAKFYELNPGLR
jgi:hypothetical protein